MKLYYTLGKRKMVLTETKIKNNFPNEFHATYVTPGVFNLQENYFKSIDENTIEWTSKSEFRFSSFMMKIISFLMPSAFKKHSIKYAEDFKNFVENNISVANK